MSDNQNSTSLQKKEQLEALLTLIERELNWGPSGDWSGTDFERLSDLIFGKTQERLSVTTLKRTWGRTTQHVKPSHTTLDILSHYAGAISWRDFQGNLLKSQDESDSIHAYTPSRRNIFYVAGGLTLGMMAIFLAASLISFDQASRPEIVAEDVKFSIHKVTTGIPNTAVFRYDVSSIVADTIELQQSWDERRRIVLNPEDSLATATYFYPGYFKAKIVADGQIVKEEHLYIPSEGFGVMVFLKDETNPRQLPDNYWSATSGMFQLESDFNMSFEGQVKEMMLIGNLMNEPLVDADTFDFSMSFRLRKDEEGDPCNPISLIVTGAEDVYMLRIGHPGCAGNFNLYLGGDLVDGENTDFSFMGFEEDEWVDMQFSKRGNTLDFILGGHKTMLSDTVKSIGRVGGARIYAMQEIEIRKLEISDRNQSYDLIQYSSSAVNIGSSEDEL